MVLKLSDFLVENSRVRELGSGFLFLEPPKSQDFCNVCDVWVFGYAIVLFGCGGKPTPSAIIQESQQGSVAKPGPLHTICVCFEPPCFKA